MYQVLTLIRFGRFDEVVEVTKRPEREMPAAAFDFSQGYAKLKLGEPEFAKAYLGQGAGRRPRRRSRSSAATRRRGLSACWPASSTARSHEPPAISPARSRSSKQP